MIKLQEVNGELKIPLLLQRPERSYLEALKAAETRFNRHNIHFISVLVVMQDGQEVEIDVTDFDISWLDENPPK